MDPAQEARRRVAAMGPRPYLNCLIGVPPETRPAWDEVLRLSRAMNGPEAPRLEGRALSFLGDPDGGVRALDRAVAAAPRDPEALAWRGEARLLMGERAAAEADFAAALAADREWPWARLLRAVCRLSAGDVAGAESDLRRLSRSREAADAAAGVYALLEGQRGRAAAGLARLVRLRRPSAFVLGVRGLLRRDAGDLAGARADLDAALRLEASPWLLSERADVLNRTGFFQEALADAARAGALLPDSPQPRAQTANIYFDQAMYPEAMAELERALLLAPQDAGLRARRARFSLVLGRLAEAEADLAAASRLAPGDAQLDFERRQVLLLMDREKEALAGLDAAGLPAAYPPFLRAYAACRRRDFAAAREGFGAAARASDGGFAQRADFYALVARVLGEGPGPVPSPEPSLYLCGIGIRHPYQITVEALRALGRCAQLYNNLGDPQVSEFLGLFGVPVAAVTRVPGEPAMGRVLRLVAGLRAERPSGFVTRIHPYIYRRIANDLVTVCREKGIGFHAFGSVSLTEVSWGLGDADAAAPPRAAGVRVFDLCHLTRRPEQLDARCATVVYCIAAGSFRTELCRLLERRYPAAHLVYILAGSGDKEREVEAVKVRDLEGRLLAVDLGAVLYVPAAPKRRK